MKTITKNIIGILLFVFAGSNAFAQSAAIVGPTINCQGTSLTLTVNINGLQPPYTYAWTNGATTSTVTISASTIIRVNVTGTNSSGNQQSVNSPWRIFLFFPAPNAAITANGPTALCTGQTVTLTATGGGPLSTYAWNSGETTSSITTGAAGNYVCVITNFFGCTSASNIITVSTYDPGVDVKVNALGPVTFCKPGSVTLEADPGYPVYQWSTGETTQSIVVALTGSGGPILDTLSVSYTIPINPGCVFSSDQIVVRSIREPKLLPPFCPNYNLTLSDSIKTEVVLTYNGVRAKYEFEFEETTNPGVKWSIGPLRRWCRLADVSPALQPGKFYLVRTRGIVDGVPYCYGAPCAIGITSLYNSGTPSRIYTDEDGEQFSVRDGLNFGIYPNPSSDRFTANVFTYSTEEIQVRVSDVTGRIVNSFSVNADETNFEFGSNLNPGIYLVEMQQGNQLRQSTKIIKTN